MLRRSALITFGERQILVKYILQPSDHDAGVMFSWADDLTLYDPITDERLKNLEEKLSESEWDTIAFLVDETID